MACPLNTPITIDTPIGVIEITTCDSGVHLVTVKKCTLKDASASITGKVKITQGKPDSYAQACIDWFQDYFSGKVNDISDVTLCQEGLTPFQKTTYQELGLLAPGQRMTYGEMSEKISGSTKSARAVGAAMKKNRQVIIVPCHRLIHSSGNIDKYSADGGSCLKSALLNHESNCKRGL